MTRWIVTVEFEVIASSEREAMNFMATQISRSPELRFITSQVKSAKLRRD